MNETRIHPVTGTILRRAVRPQTVRVGSLSRVVDVPGWYPEDESDSIHSGADFKVRDATFDELRDAYAARVKAVRKKLGLTQEEAGRLIGGGKRAFQRYERGVHPPSDAAVGLIELLDRHPQEIEVLRTLRQGDSGVAADARMPRRVGPGGPERTAGRNARQAPV